MGLVIDSSVLIAVERRSASLRDLLPSGGQGIAIAAVTAAELLEGLYWADPSRRSQREAFVEAVLADIPIIAFGLDIARVYARLLAELRRAGQPIGTHDLQIAATAVFSGYSVFTENLRHFRQVPDLAVLQPHWQ